MLVRPLIAILAGGLLASLALAEPVSQSLTPPAMQSISPAAAHALVADLQQQLGVQEVPALAPFPAAGNGRVSVQPLYSSQRGSWPFESFVHAGLFKVIGGFQTSHPKMLQVDGVLSFTQLRQQLGSHEALRPHKDGFLLAYPLMIAPGGSLTLDGVNLYLHAHAGAAIINQGRLQILNSQIESWSGDNTQKSYRPFIMTWAGSQTRIVDSQLLRLGYNAHLARGLSAARSSQQAASVPAARLYISGSQLEGLSSVQLQDVDLRLENTRISQMQLYGLDAENSRLSVLDSRISGVRNHSGIRLRGTGQALLRNNQLSQTGKAGLELSGFAGQLLAEGNQLEKNGTHALQVRELRGTARALLRGNRLAEATQNLVDAQGDGLLVFAGNRFERAGHAISLSGGQVLVLDNHFATVDQSALRTDAATQVLIGGNGFDAQVLLHRLFQGSLLPVQSEIVETTLTRGCYLWVGGSAQDGHSAPCAPAGQL